MTTTAPKASPTARRMAEALGVDLTSIAGSGPGGRIVKEDVEAAGAGGSPNGSSPPSGPSVTSAPEPAAPAVTAVPDAPAEPPIATATPPAGAPAPAPQRLTSSEKVVARRMAESRATVPEFELHVVVDMERAVATRAALKDAARDGAPVPSVNDMVVRAGALALRNHPRANGSYTDAGFVLHDRVNVGVAVAGPGTLLVPVVPDADALALSALAARTRDLAVRGREGRLAPPDFDGGTFTVSNLGMFGVRSFTAVINVPQAAILAVGALERRAVVEGDAVVARHLMDLTLCCDHRILYGADAAAFLAELRANLEVPERLM